MTVLFYLALKPSEVENVQLACLTGNFKRTFDERAVSEPNGAVSIYVL